MSTTTILIIILVLILIGALPTWPYSSGWGYYPSGGLGLILLIIIILALTGRLSQRPTSATGTGWERTPGMRSRLRHERH
jgi:Protein of unknown function (DUF3309)